MHAVCAVNSERRRRRQWRWREQGGVGLHAVGVALAVVGES